MPKHDFNIESHMERHKDHDCEFYRKWNKECDVSARGKPCAYCQAPAVHWDHTTPRSVWKRGQWPQWAAEQVPACFNCNIRKGTRLLIPPSWEDRLQTLNALGYGKFRIWHGDVETLHEVAK